VVSRARVNPFLSRGPVAPLIAAELRGRTELPRGEAARIARKLDCSRERVRQIMGKLGVRVEPSLANVIDCADCGKQIRANTLGICAACRHERTLVELTCISCGRTFKRRRKDHNDFIRRVTIGPKQGPRCSRTCGYSRAIRVCSWCGADAGHKAPSNRGNHAFCGAPRRCDREARKLVQPLYWRLLTPEVLPMRDSIAKITELLGPDRLTGGKAKGGQAIADASGIAALRG